DVVVSDSTPREVRPGAPVALLPQLAQPSRCLAALQSRDSKAPVLGDDSIGTHAGIYFDGTQSLTTNAALDVPSFTIVAVVKGAGSSGGTIIGPNRPAADDPTG